MPDAVWLTTSVAGSGFQDCGTCGASVQWKRITQHVNFHKNYSNQRSEDMSRVSWCDYGNHPFKKGVEGSASFNGTEYNKDGVPVTVEMEACPDHNPMNVAREAARYELTPEAYQELNKKGENE